MLCESEYTMIDAAIEASRTPCLPAEWIVAICPPDAVSGPRTGQVGTKPRDAVRNRVFLHYLRTRTQSIECRSPKPQLLCSRPQTS